MANFWGQQWTAYLPVTPLRQLNIVRGDRVVFNRILHFLLLQKGEDPLHPEMGAAVPLFYPLTDDRAEWVVYNLKQDLINWNTWAAIGIKSLEVEVNNQREFTNELGISIRYTTIAGGGATVLTFGFFDYDNARATGDVDRFLDAIAINGVRLREWGFN